VQSSDTYFSPNSVPGLKSERFVELHQT